MKYEQMQKKPINDKNTWPAYSITLGLIFKSKTEVVRYCRRFDKKPEYLKLTQTESDKCSKRLSAEYFLDEFDAIPNWLHEEIEALNDQIDKMPEEGFLRSIDVAIEFTNEEYLKELENSPY